ncbi:hypothetical protein PF002_g24674 [Phytophthora fragariae]|uniref:Integrase catalytic domain-containing protein n=3 Tax=Phytophthora fragariae TaxID=53985 RepID=A0A6A3WU32_9STRA|nr:hypothetical protein PF002_g24674 [Phytophthora fragariae]
MKPLLIYPDFRLPFRLVTDASKVGLGACLMQDQGRGWQPMAFASKVNNNAEANYSITELECLAVVWAVKLFRPYLYGRTFEIITDHAALKWLMTRPNLAGRLHRWSLTLQEFEFGIVYRPGATNVVADALSRAPAAVLAAAGRKRKRRVRAESRGDAESTTEEDEPPAEGMTTETEQTAVEAVGTPVATVVTVEPGQMPEVAVMSPRGKLVGVGEAEVFRNDGCRTVSPPAESSHPRTRLAKKREEAADVATCAADQETTLLEITTESPTIPASSAGRGDDAGALTATEDVVHKGPQSTATRVTWADNVKDGETEADASITAPVPQRTRTRTSRKVAPCTPAVAAGDAAKSASDRAQRKAQVEWVSETAGHGEVKDEGGDEAVSERGTDKGVASKTVSDGPVNEDDELTEEPDVTLQLTDNEIMAAQEHSQLVQQMLKAGSYRSMKVESLFGLVVIHTARGKRVILPPALWSVVFKELHGSIWAGHLRGPHTYGRDSQLYWWPGLHGEVNRWVRGCQECGSRKARPRQVIPPLRSLRGGDVGDRWALDVAGPFPVAEGGERYVIAALEYVTRYAVARSVTRHTADDVATFLMEDVVLKFGAFRELLTDGAPEMTGLVLDQLVSRLQAKQTNPVPYRPQMIGLVERFHRSWKDCVATFMADDKQNDWSGWVQCAVYAYNSANHSTVALSPNELMMGRRLRPPNELLRRTELTEVGELPQYHERLLAAMARGRVCAERARDKEQARQARYYDQNVRRRQVFKAGDRVWMFNPPRGPKATKFMHQWMGPMRIIEPVGYENFVLKREDKNGRAELIVAHVSFLVNYQSPVSLLPRIADDLAAQLEHEDSSTSTTDSSDKKAKSEYNYNDGRPELFTC